MQRWNDAIQKGDEAAYNNFMQFWNNIKNNQGQQQGTTNQEQQNAEPWKIALVNQIEGQSTIASILGINLSKELYALREKAINAKKNNVTIVLDSVMNEWKKINDQIAIQSQNTTSF